MTRETGIGQPPTERRCAVYTRKSSEDGLELEYNSLDAQYDAAVAYIRSQAGNGWRLLEKRYDDGGFSGGNSDSFPDSGSADDAGGNSGGSERFRAVQDHP